MPHYIGGARTICPYYIKEQAQGIQCEGMCAGTRLQTQFDSREAKEAWQAEACHTNGYAARCPLAAWLEAKYTQGEEEPPWNE